MAIQMTAEEYQAKYGQAPVLGGVKTQVTQTTAPVAPIPDEPSTFQNLTSSIGDRLNKIKQNTVDVATGKQGDSNPALKAYSTAAQTVGILGDTLGAGLKGITDSIAPPSVKEGATKALQDIGSSQTIQDALVKMKQLETDNPKTAEFLHNTVDFGKFLLNFVGIKGASKLAEVPLTPLEQGIKNIPGAMADQVTPTINKIGTATKNLGEAATGAGVTMTVPTRQAMQAYEAAQPSLFGRVKNFLNGTEAVGVKPITEANTAARNGLAGTEWQLGVQSKKLAGNIWKDVVQPALNESDAKVNKNTFFDSLRKRIISENADLTRRNTLLNALDSFSEDYKHVNDFGLPKLQEYKEGWAKFVPDKAYKGQPIAGALSDVRNMAAGEARKIIYDTLGDNVKTAYLDYGNLQSIEDAGIKSIDALRSKSPSRQVWEAVLDKAVTPVATFSGKVLYKLGNGLELVGEKGAKKLRDIVK